MNNARNYLKGVPDWNDHPPLGKLLMALSMSRLGDTAFAFRLPSALLETLTIISAGLLAQRVFRRTLAGLLAAAFIAADGFSLLALCAMTFRSPVRVLLAGALVGTGMAIKMSAVVLLAPLLMLGIVRATQSVRPVRDRVGPLRLFGADLSSSPAELASYPLAVSVALFVYLWWWTIGLSMTHQPHTLMDAVEATRKMMAHHAGLTDWEHPLLSRWWTWALPTKPILLRKDVLAGGMVRAMTSMGNPLIWWATVIATLGTLLDLVTRVAKRRYKPVLGHGWLVLTFVAYLSPWIVTNRDSYIYHYLPAYAIGIVLLSGLLTKFSRTQRNEMVLLVGTCCVTLVLAFFAPVWAQLPLSPAALEMRPLIE